MSNQLASFALRASAREVSLGIYNMKKYAIIVAAGSGNRMGGELPKQFIELEGKPLFCHTLLAFSKAFPDIHIILVMHPSHLDMASEMTSRFFPFAITQVAGASTRFGSVRAGLALVEDGSIVFVHDGVRCLLTADLIRRCYFAAKEKGNAIPSIGAIDSVRIEKNGTNEAIDRNLVRMVQTPQTFNATLLKQAYARASREDFTDDAAVAENAGIRINLVEGEMTNIKITHPGDVAMAEMILKERREP